MNFCLMSEEHVSHCLQVLEGSEPNEHGTWQYGRGGWCDGQEVSTQFLLETIHLI